MSNLRTKLRRKYANLRLGVVLSVLVLGLQPTIWTATVAGATSSPAVLQPAAGQYFPITPVKILDTRDGTGTNGTVSTISAGASVAFIPVEGMGEIPTSGVESVFVNIEVFSPSNSGYITAYEANASNPGHANLSFQAGKSTSGSDLVTVAPPGSNGDGEITITNNGYATIDVAIYVEGYFGDGTLTAAGDTYHGVQWTTLVDTRYGTGIPGSVAAPLAGGSSIQISPTDLAPLGVNGSDSRNVDAVEIEIGALAPAGSSYLYASGLNGLPPTRTLSYQSGQKTRVTDILQPDLNGNITIHNAGPYSVNVQITLRGYFLTPTAYDLNSDTYVPLSTPTTICDTRTADGCTYGATKTFGPIAANGSITVQETGVGGVPSMGVGFVANEINAVAPTATGYLTVDWPGDSTPSGIAAVNFTASDSGDASFDNSVISQASPSGAIVITNHSNGPVQIVVSARGYWIAPSAPLAPTYLYGALWGGQVVLEWSAPNSDGGEPIQGYDVTLTSADGMVNQSQLVSGSTYGATFANIADVSMMTVSVQSMGLIPGGGSASAVIDSNASPVGATYMQLNAPSLSAEPSGNVQPNFAVGYQATLTDLTFDSNGSLTSSASYGVQSQNNAMNTNNLQSGTCMLRTSKGSAIVGYTPFTQSGATAGASYLWKQNLYSEANARFLVDPMTNTGYYTQQWQDCTWGGAAPTGEYKLWFAGLAMTNTTSTASAIVGAKWGTGTTGTSGTTVTTNLGIGVGNSTANGSIGASITIVPGKGTLTGDFNADGKFQGYPSFLASFNNNRVNNYWISPHNWIWDGSTSFKGNVGQTLYEYPMSTTVNGMSFPTVVEIGTFCGNNLTGC